MTKMAESTAAELTHANGIVNTQNAALHAYNTLDRVMRVMEGMQGK